MQTISLTLKEIWNKEKLKDYILKLKVTLKQLFQSSWDIKSIMYIKNKNGII